MDTTRFERWLADMRHAWESRDPDAAARLFTDDALYHETPFDEPARGRTAIREYWAQVPRSQDQVRFRSHVLAVVGDLGMAHWQASFLRIPSGVAVELDGVLLARFNAAELCTEFREWWHRREHPAGTFPAVS